MKAAMIARKALSPFKLLASPPPPAAVLASFFSTSSSSSQLHQWSPQQAEESRSQRVNVWWDLHSCPVPDGVSLYRVSRAIEAAVRANGLKGPMAIEALIDDDLFSNSRDWEALFTTGMTTNNVCLGQEDSAVDLVDRLMEFVDESRPTPSHVLLITDRDFGKKLQEIREMHYNVLFASNRAPDDAVRSAASIVLRWDDLVTGKNVVGQRINQPPWYGGQASNYNYLGPTYINGGVKNGIFTFPEWLKIPTTEELYGGKFGVSGKSQLQA